MEDFSKDHDLSTEAVTYKAEVELARTAMQAAHVTKAEASLLGVLTDVEVQAKDKKTEVAAILKKASTAQTELKLPVRSKILPAIICEANSVLLDM